MNDGWEIDIDKQKEILIDHGKNIALTALQQYDLAWTEIKFNKLSDAITFKIETETGRTFCFVFTIKLVVKEKLRANFSS